MPGWFGFKRPSNVVRTAWALALLSSVVLSGCTSPAKIIDDRARGAGFQTVTLVGTGFHHRSYYNGLKPSSDRLHVYIEGDGTPWRTPNQIAADPTSRDPLALHLMLQDREDALYLGRPCYNGLAREPPCNPMLWTFQRYSRTVVESMRQALAGFVRQHEKRQLIFIGYSGGGALARLLAPAFAQTRALVTIAANLDIAAWTSHHRYAPLVGSLNPAEAPPLAATIAQFHYAGAADENIPPDFLRAPLSREGAAELIVVPEFDHKCCWLRIWPGALQRLSAID